SNAPHCPAPNPPYGNCDAFPLERMAKFAQRSPRSGRLLNKTGIAPAQNPRELTHMSTTSRRLCATTLLALPLMAAPAAAWEPTKPVEIVVAAGAGGASDQMARMIQAAVQKNNLMKQPMVVSLKGGASGAEALIYMKGSDGDAHKFLIAYSLIYTLPLSAKIPFDWRNLTPVALVALDQFVLWTNTSLPYKTVKEFTDAA